MQLTDATQLKINILQTALALDQRRGKATVRQGLVYGEPTELTTASKTNE